jgi:hypothetical protein
VDVLATVARPTEQTHDVEGDSDKRAGARGWHQIGATPTATSHARVSVVRCSNLEEAERALPAPKAKSSSPSQPARQSHAPTPGIRPGALFGFGTPTRTAVQRTRLTSVSPSKSVVAAEPDLPTVEIIRGDKRAHEVVRQEQ